MECLHRFCRECIDKSMRLGNNECPACRTHCASRRSLRDDPNYDALIAAIYPDIDKYDEEAAVSNGGTYFCCAGRPLWNMGKVHHQWSLSFCYLANRLLVFIL